MTIGVTGAMGSVGRHTLMTLLEQGHNPVGFDVPSRRNRRSARNLDNRIRMIWGDILNISDVSSFIQEVDAVIHLAAIIPPLADKYPQRARFINVDGTENIVRLSSKYKPGMRFVFSSSIAVYGDRRQNPYIGRDDRPNPNHDDVYARHKLDSESIIKASDLNWTIFRLSYILNTKQLKFIPLMFDMPLETGIEICDVRDTALALVNSIESGQTVNKTLHLAGGHLCRTTYGQYLSSMFHLFGLGSHYPQKAFSKKPFHCGYMDTEESQNLLHYQRRSLKDLYNEIKKLTRIKRFFIQLVRPIARRVLLRRSPYLRNG